MWDGFHRNIDFSIWTLQDFPPNADRSLYRRDRRSSRTVIVSITHSSSSVILQSTFYRISRVMAAEMTTKSQLGSAYAYLQIAYRVGQISGQPMGGSLSHPERIWPTLAKLKFWNTYPFALPCMVAAILTWGVIAISIFTLPETSNVKANKDNKNTIEETQSNYGSIGCSEIASDKNSTFHEQLKTLLTWDVINVFVATSFMSFNALTMSVL
jgi:MFS family permease